MPIFEASNRPALAGLLLLALCIGSADALCRLTKRNAGQAITQLAVIRPLG